MRNVLLGTVGGLILGTLGALAYSHYLGDGSLAEYLQSQLDAANAKLAKSEADRKFLAEQNKGESDQLNQLVASNDELKKHVASPGDAPSAPAAPTATPSLFDPNLIRGIMGAMRGGGFRSPEQRMFLLQARLKLSPDQLAKIKAAMDADEQARRDAFRQARENGTPPDPQALAAANTLDKTLASTLTEYQQTQYQQLQADEKAARAETSATAQIDNLMPLLQLSDDQKEKAMNALYQQQLSAPDPASLLANPTTAVSTLATQGQTMQAALQKVLTPDQYALYQQQQQVTLQAWGNNGGQRGPGGGAGGGTAAQAATVAPPATPSPAPAAVAPANTPTTDTTSAATNAASASTNAASASAPAPVAN
jgi:hypothetical protein